MEALIAENGTVYGKDRNGYTVSLFEYVLDDANEKDILDMISAWNESRKDDPIPTFTHPLDSKDDQKWVCIDDSDIRIDAINCGGQYPIQGAIYDAKDDIWRQMMWTNEGAAADPRKNIIDLRESTLAYGYLNINDNDDALGGLYNSRNEADCLCSPNRIACIKLLVDIDKVRGRFDQ